MWPFFLKSVTDWRTVQWSEDEASWWANQARENSHQYYIIDGCPTSKGSLSVCRAGKPFCVFHIVVKQERSSHLAPQVLYQFLPDLLCHVLSWNSFLILCKVLGLFSPLHCGYFHSELSVLQNIAVRQETGCTFKYLLNICLYTPGMWYTW